ncbi:Os12g0635801 [Oryza sativa Japonica Group]|uniref:Os12g0635801 protein n=1 Tax=Oryza sativa subsp. japonica TaxID=39947 RepID=A0A0P0YE43_ORYSJ|nr:Os12g0635801 [Oryza sativa Japonica Group]
MALPVASSRVAAIAGTRRVRAFPPEVDVWAANAAPSVRDITSPVVAIIIVVVAPSSTSEVIWVVAVIPPVAPATVIAVIPAPVAVPLLLPSSAVSANGVPHRSATLVANLPLEGGGVVLHALRATLAEGEGPRRMRVVGEVLEEARRGSLAVKNP